MTPPQRLLTCGTCSSDHGRPVRFAKNCPRCTDGLPMPSVLYFLGDLIWNKNICKMTSKKNNLVRSLSIGTRPEHDLIANSSWHLLFSPLTCPFMINVDQGGSEFHDQRRAGLPFGREMSASLRLLF